MTAADRPIPDIGSSRRVPAHSPIMTGIARHFHVVSKLQYCAGFSLQDYDQLLLHLLWRVSKRTLRSISAIRHPAGSVPSWSWASMSMHEGDYIIPKREFRTDASIFKPHPECRIAHLFWDDGPGRDVFSASKGCLIIRGPLVLGTIVAASWMSSRERDRDGGAYFMPANFPNLDQLSFRPSFALIPELESANVG